MNVRNNLGTFDEYKNFITIIHIREITHKVVCYFYCRIVKKTLSS